MPQIDAADPKGFSEREWERLKENQRLHREVMKLRAEIEHFKLNFEEQKKTLLWRIGHAATPGEVAESIKTFEEKVFDPPVFALTKAWFE